MAFCFLYRREWHDACIKEDTILELFVSMHSNFKNSTCQSGFTIIELMIVIAIIAILAAVALVSYNIQIRKTHITTIYHEINQFRLPYQILMGEGAGVTGFSPEGLNMPTQTKYCQFSVTPPNVNTSTPNAVRCQIQNLSYLQNQSLNLERATDGTWQCRASSGITKAYLPQACQ